MSFIIALALGAGILALVLWIRNQNTMIIWYEWLLGVVGLLLLLAAIQHYAGSLTEKYTTAGWMGALAFGIPGLILLAVVWQLISRRQRAAG